MQRVGSRRNVPNKRRTSTLLGSFLSESSPATTLSRTLCHLQASEEPYIKVDDASHCLGDNDGVMLGLEGSSDGEPSKTKKRRQTGAKKSRTCKSHGFSGPRRGSVETDYCTCPIVHACNLVPREAERLGL